MRIWSYLRSKPWLLHSAKVVFGALLIVWLLRSGALNFEPLRSISLLQLLQCGILGVSITAISTARTRMLLRDQQVRVSFRRCFAVSCVGLFYSLFLPGGVSGDAARALYFFKDAPNKRGATLGALFLDRFLGLITLVGLGLASGALLLSVIPSVANYLIGFGVFLVALVVGLVWILRQGAVSDESVPVSNDVTRTVWSRFHLLMARLQLDKYSATTLVGAASLSVLMNSITILLIYECSVLSDAKLPFLTVAAVSPLGLLTNAVPLSPGGLGVGEKSFDMLYAAVGGQQGAVSFLMARLFLYFPAIFGGLVAIYSLASSGRSVSDRPVSRTPNSAVEK